MILIYMLILLYASNKIVEGEDEWVRFETINKPKVKTLKK